MMRALDSMVYCIDRASGKIVQSLALKNGDPNMGIRPARLVAAEDMVWAVYYDKFLGLQAAK